jgi:hypothetical protein
MDNKGLKTHTLIGTCLAAVLPCLALADAPGNVALGEIDAILKFCAKTDPRLAADVEKQLTALLGKASPGARGSTEYRQGFDLVSDALATVSNPTALAACSALANPAPSNKLNPRK